MTNVNEQPRRVPGWLKGVAFVLRVIGLGLLFVVGISLRVLRRVDPTLAIVLVLLLLVGMVLLFGVGIYFQVVVADGAKIRPAKGVGFLRLVCGLLIAVPVFIGFRTTSTVIRMLEYLTVGVLPTAEYGLNSALVYAPIVALGLLEAINGGLAILGIRLKSALQFVVLLAALAGTVSLGLALRPASRVAVIPLAMKLPVLALSDDGSRLVAVEQSGKVKVWDTSTGDSTGEFQDLVEDVPVAPRLAMSSDNRMLAVQYANGILVVHELPSGETKLKISTGATSVPYAPKAGETYSKEAEALQLQLGAKDLKFFEGHSRLLLATGQELKSIEVESGKTDTLFRAPQPGQIAAISPQGTHLAVGSTTDDYLHPVSTVRVWDVKSGTETFQQEFKDARFSDLDLGPDGKLLAVSLKSSATTFSDYNNWSAVYDCETKTAILSTVMLELYSIHSARLSADGNKVLLVDGYFAEVRRLSDGQQLFSTRENGLGDAVWSSNGDILVNRLGPNANIWKIGR